MFRKYIKYNIYINNEYNIQQRLEFSKCHK